MSLPDNLVPYTLTLDVEADSIKQSNQFDSIREVMALVNRVRACNPKLSAMQALILVQTALGKR